MKTCIKKIRNDKKGMTYVEVLVALALLALIVVVFTPALMMSYSHLYKAGEIVSDSYNAKTTVESRLALRDTDYGDLKTDLEIKFEEMENRFKTKVMKISTDISGLGTVYGKLKPSAVIFSGYEIYDDSASTDVVLYLKNLEASDVETMKDATEANEDKTKIRISFSTPLAKENGVSPITVGDPTANAAGNKVTVPLGNIDVTYSPIQVNVFYYDTNDKACRLTEYIVIKPAQMMFVGKANAATGYYTAAPLSATNTELHVEGRTMRGALLTNGQQFNKVAWVDAGVDDLGGTGYYAMCGNNGIIRRLWTLSESEKQTIGLSGSEAIGYAKYTDTKTSDVYFKTNWGGDFTESYRYDIFEGGGPENDGIWRDSNWVYGTKAITMTKYSGYNLASDDGGLFSSNMFALPSSRCIALSKVLADTATTFSGTEQGKYVTIADSVRSKTEPVNWFTNDGKGRWGDAGGTDYNIKDMWTNTLNGNQVVFKASTAGNASTIYAVAQCNSKGSYLKEGDYWVYSRVWPGDYYYSKRTEYKLWFSSSDAQLTNSNQLPPEQAVHTPREKPGYVFAVSGYSNHWCASCDVGATFENYVFSAEGKNTYDFNSASYNSKSLAEKQKYIKEFILEYFADDVKSYDASVNHVVNTDTNDAGDSGLAYVRVKAYSNLSNADIGLMLSKNNGSIKDEEQSAADSATKATVNLTDILFIKSAALSTDDAALSANNLNYLGYSASSALIYSSIPLTTTNAHDLTKIYKIYLLKGSLNSGFSMNYGQYNDHLSNMSEASAKSALPYTESDSDTYLSLGYSSKRALLYDASVSMAKSTLGTLADACDITSNDEEKNKHAVYPDDYATYTSYAQQENLTVAVGYTLACYSKVNAVLCENCKNSAHTGIDQSYPLDFVSGNKMFGMTKDTSYMFLDSANDGHDRKVCLLKAPTCACAYTDVDKVAVNEGLIAVKPESANTFTNIYYQKMIGDDEVRFTSAAVAPEANGTSYVIFAGDSKGYLYAIEVHVNGTAVTRGAVYARYNTGLSTINSVYRSDNKLIVCGSGKTASVVVYTISSVETNLPNILSKKQISGVTAADKLYDVIYCKDYFYMVGSNSSNTAGVVYYSKDAQNWTRGADTTLPLYSIAAQEE